MIPRRVTRAAPFATSGFVLRHAGTGERAKHNVLKPVDELSAWTREILGPNSVARFEEFRALPPSWHFGKGRTLSPASVATMELFLALHPAFPTRPSLFMTEAGNLELAWDVEEGGRVEVEFFPDRLEYYLERDDEEGEVLLPSVHALLEKLGRTGSAG